jgi:hypothetical protein
MSTLIKSACLWFSEPHQRWMTASEALTCQGFPLDGKYTHNQATNSFDSRNLGLCKTEWPSRSATFGMSGNSMHLNVAGCIELFCITQVNFPVFTQRLMSLSLRRAATDSDDDDDRNS